MKRPYKLKAYLGGMYGTVANTRSYATPEAAERVAAQFRKTGWTTRVWKQAAR